ncbi:MAG TPA: glycosyltransferase family 2 protein [candidate division Zixibacteria bacterium]|nr:glycosyltransferase family 2 protein [candidate division Zixibacteria bacterium]
MALVSIVFSFRNEQEVLPLLIRRVSEALQGIPEDMELIFVDDASTDNSVGTIRALANQVDNLRLVQMSRRFGVEECFFAGLEHAKGDAVVLMYADMQDPPEVVREMLARWRQGADIVHGVRRRRLGESKAKIVAAHVAYRIINRIAEIPIPTDAGDFKLISRVVVNHLLKLRESDPYLRGLIPWVGYTQDYVEYDLQPRAAGRSHVPLFGRKAWTVFLSGLTSFSMGPIYLILILGVVGTVIVACSMATLTVVFLFKPVPFWALWLTVALLLWSTVMLALGVVGFYVGRIYKDVRGRPRYIVKKVHDLGRKGSNSAYG